MNAHPLKIVSLVSILALICCQLSLMFTLEHSYRIWIAIILIIPLLIPLKGLVNDQRYTYKWIGFLTLFYFSVGVSEGFAAPENRWYSVLTTSFSLLLFLASMYYSRYLRTIQK